MKVLKNIICLLFCLSIFFNNSYALGLKSGYKALHIYNYFRAKRIFERIIKRRKVGASYGLATIYYRIDNPFHNYDSAYTYIIKAQNNYVHLKVKKRIKLDSLGVDSLNIEKLFKNICRSAFKHIVDSNTVAAYQHYIDFYKAAPYLAKAKKDRNALAYKIAQKNNTADAYKNFIDNYPEANEKAAATKKYEKTLYREMTQENTIKAYKHFIEAFPKSPYVNKAYDKIYILSIKSKTVNSYYQFIKHNPNNPNVNNAWECLLALYAPNFKTIDLKRFLDKFPAYPQGKELQKLIILNNKQFYTIKSGKKWGFIDEQGDMMIPPRYDWVGEFHEGIAIVGLGNKNILINKLGKQTILPAYDEINRFINGYSVVSKKDKYGLIDRNGNLEIPLIYNDLSSAYKNLCAAEKNNTYGFINTSGKIKIPFQYTAAGDFDKDFTYIQQGKFYGIIDTLGKQIIAPVFDWIGDYELGDFRAKKEGKFGLLNTKGDTLVSFKYKYLGNFSDSLALLIDSNSYVYINPKGDTVINPKIKPSPAMYSWANFKNGLALFKKKDGYGLIDKKGNIEIKANYTEIQDFDSTYAIAKKRQCFYIINLPSGKKVQLNKKYISLKRVSDYLIAGTSSGKHTLLNMSGKIITAFGKVNVAALNDNPNYLLVSDTTRKYWGIYNVIGKSIILKPQFSSIKYLGNNIFKIKNKKQDCLYNASLSKFIWKPE